MKRKLTIAAALAAITCICLFGADPEWTFMFDNEQTNGPAKALRIDGKQITGEYRIDYSTNLVPKHWPGRVPEAEPETEPAATLQITASPALRIRPDAESVLRFDSFKESTHTNYARFTDVTNVLFGDHVRLLTEKTFFEFTTTPQAITNVINGLVASGEFCRVRGHAWGEHLHTTLEYQPNKIGCRECKVCGTHQTQYATDWK